MEHNTDNRFALLGDETRPPSPVNHAPPPGMFITAADVAAMEAAATTPLTPTDPTEPPLPTTLSDGAGLNKSTPAAATPNDPELSRILAEGASPPPPSPPAYTADIYMEVSPSPDTIFERQAAQLYGAWLSLVKNMNPKSYLRLHEEYSANGVGNQDIWLLSCWLHRAPAPRVLDFLRAHSPPTGIVEAIQHAFETRLTRLRGQLSDHSKHAAAVRVLLADWTNGIGHLATPSPPSPGPATIEALREALPSPLDRLAAGTTSAPISVSSGDSSVALIPPRALAALERAQRRTTRSQTPMASPISRRPSVSLQDMSTLVLMEQDAEGGSSSSTTPTAPEPPWPHAIPKEDWPTEWGSHTPSPHSSVAGDSDGHHPRRPIVIDTPSPSVHSAPATMSPPEDMGRPDPKGKMSTAGGQPRPLSPMEVFYGPSTQTQEARTALDELRELSKQVPPTQAEVNAVADASTDEAAEWANIWAETIAPMREGYARYALRDPIPLLKGGNRIEPAHALDTAFRVVVAAVGAGFDKPGFPQDRTLNSGHWFRGVSAVLGATLRGMLVSQGFFDQGSWPLDPCLDTFTIVDGLERPHTQIELVRSMTEQLLSELTVQGEDRLNREDLWNSIKEQEIAMLRDAMQKQAEASAEIWEREMLASLKGKAVDLALDNLVADLEAEGTALAPGAQRAKEILDRYTAGKGIAGLKPVPLPQMAKWQNEYVQIARKELEAEAHAQAEREWRAWRETELAKATGEAMRRLSIDHIIEKCGPDAAALIAEKQAFAKDYVHCNYQNWLNQVLSEQWPAVEADAQKVTREEYFNRELAAIYPEVHKDAYEAARKEANEAAERHRERLTAQMISTVETDHDGQLYRASIKANTTRKAAESQKNAGKKARAIKVDARRTDITEVLDRLDSEEPTLITTTQLQQHVLEDANVGSNEAPNAALKLGVAMGMLQPIAGLEPPVRPLPDPSPSPETIGEQTPSPAHRPTMVLPLDINEEVAANRTISSSEYAREAKPSLPPAAGHLELYAMMQQLLAPIQESVDALRLRVEVLDDRTLPQPTRAIAQPSHFPPQEAIEEDFPMLASPSPPSGSSPDPCTAGRPASVQFAPQIPVPSPPGPPLKEATAGASTTAEAPSPPSGARTATEEAAPSPPTAPSPPAPKPKGKGSATGASTASVAPSPPTKGARTAKDNDGFIPVSRPKLAYNIVSAKAVQQQQLSKQQATTSAAAQQRTASGRLQPGASPAPRNTTRVVVARNGGLPDAAKEAALRADLPERIAASVRSAIERSTSSSVKKEKSGKVCRWSILGQSVNDILQIYRFGSSRVILTLADLQLTQIDSEWLGGPWPGRQCRLIFGINPVNFCHLEVIPQSVLVKF
ncbi:hypothetical protein EDB85DRAFT_1898322 [Lactarius pseudohatsudake]|nr:hypothetical protein EDB85DRAFT_1898322 [Lactarius pseudohatsudake]